MNYFILIQIVLFEFLASICDSTPINNHHKSSSSCHNLKQIYQPLSIHNHPHQNHNQRSNHRLQPHHQQSLNCPSSIDPSNCCHDIDHLIGHKARNDFANQLESTMKISMFEQHFHQYYNRLHRKLNGILNDTIISVNEHFAITSTNTNHYNHRIVYNNQKLFEFIRSIIFDSATKQQNYLQLNDYIDRLLESIFITVLQQPYQNKFPNEYESCLLATMKDLDILSQTRDEMLFRFGRTIEIGSLIVHSLQDSLQLINQTNELKMINMNCQQKLSQTFHCHRCHSKSSTTTTLSMANHNKPCKSLCLETITDCLDHKRIDRMDSTIKTLNRSYQQLVNLMINYFNPEILMSTHRQSIVQAQEHIRSKYKIAKKVRISCGSIKRYFRSATNNGNVMTTTNNNNNNNGNEYSFYNYSSSSPTTTTTLNSSNNNFNKEISATSENSLYVSIQSLAHLFAKNKDIFSQISNKICNEHLNDENCWNGTQPVSSYQPHHHHDSGHHNTDGDDDMMIITLHDRVKKSESTIKELLDQCMTRSSGDNLNNHQLVDHYTSNNDDDTDIDNGSGSGSNPMYDDEDYSNNNNNFEEGSGDLSSPIDSDDHQQQPIFNQQPPNSASSDIVIDSFTNDHNNNNLTSSSFTTPKTWFDTTIKHSDSSARSLKRFDLKLLLINFVYICYYCYYYYLV